MTLQSLENLLTSQHARVKQNRERLSVSEISSIYGKISAEATTTYTNDLSNGYITKNEYEYAQKAFPRNLDNGKNIAQRLRGFMNIVNTEAQKPSSHQQQDMSTVSWIQPELTKLKPNMYYTYKDSHIGNGVIPSNLSSLKARTLIKILRKSARYTRVIIRTSGGRAAAIHGSSSTQRSQSAPQSESNETLFQQDNSNENTGNTNPSLTSDINDNPKSILAFSDRTYNKNSPQTSTMSEKSQPSSSEHEVIFPSNNSITSNPYHSDYQTQRAQQDKFAQQQATPNKIKRPTRSKRKKGGLFSHVKSFFSGRLKNVAQKIDEAKDSKNVTRPPKVSNNTQGVNSKSVPKTNNLQQLQNKPYRQTLQKSQNQDTQIPTPPNTPYSSVNQNTQGVPKSQYQTQTSQGSSKESSNFVASMGLNYKPTSNSNDVIENNPYSPDSQTYQSNQNKEQQVNNIKNSIESKNSSSSSTYTAPSSSSNSHIAHVVKVVNSLSHSSSSNNLKREEKNQLNKVVSSNNQISSNSNNSSASTSSFLQSSELNSLTRSAELSASKSVSEVISANAAKSTKAMFAKSNTSSLSSKGKEQSSMNASKQKVSKVKSNQKIASAVSKSTEDSIKSSVASSANSKSKSILANDKTTATKAMPKNNIASQNNSGNASNFAHDSEDIKDGAIGFIKRFYSLNSSIRSKANNKLHSAKIENAILNDKFNSFASKASSTSVSASKSHQKDLNDASIRADINTSNAVASAYKSASSSASTQLISNISSADSMKGSLNQSFANVKAQMTKDNDERTSVEVSSAIDSARNSVLADEQKSISTANFQVEKANYRISYYSNQAQFHSNALSMLDSYYGDQASEIAQKAKQINATRLLTAKFIQNNKGKKLPEIKDLKDLQNHLKNQK